MRLDILSGQSESKYLEFNSRTAINWYPNVSLQSEKGGVQLGLFPTPGLKAHTADLGGVGRGIYTVTALNGKERCFAVIGTDLYEVFQDGSTTNHGTLAHVKTNSIVYMQADASNNLMIVHDNTGSTFNLSTDTLTTPIADADFNGANTLEYMDGYFIVTPTTGNVGRVQFSELNDPTSWVGDSVYTPTSKADGVQRVIAWRDELYNFGKNTIEVYAAFRF